MRKPKYQVVFSFFVNLNENKVIKHRKIKYKDEEKSITLRILTYIERNQTWYSRSYRGIFDLQNFNHMPRVKAKRQSVSIDMTAMSDVAFLLLNFFVMTSVTKVPDPVDIKLPTSTYKVQVPEQDMAILTVSDKGTVYFETLGQDIMVRTLEKMGEKYKISFTEEEKKRFSLVRSFGVPIQNLKQYIALDGEKRKDSGLGTGIPIDSANNQLYFWILHSREAVAELHATQMRVSVKGDENIKYPDVKKIIDILQKQKINKFSLVTSSE